MSDDLRRRVRHDLRGPLAVILGRAELLATEVHGSLNPAQLRSVEAIVRNAQRLVDELDALADDLDQMGLRG